MKAQVIHQFGGPEVFETMELPKPELKPGTVLIRVEATSVNPVDTKIRSGAYAGLAAPFPTILHGDVAGVIEAVSSEVSQFKVGDEVYGCAGGLVEQGGALAEFMLADAKFLAKKPQSLKFPEAAALPLVAITAWEALFEKAHLQPKQNVLIHAGTGGVGHIAIQLAAWAGANVYATVSSKEKAELAKSLGAKDVIFYRDESVSDYVQRLTDGKGFDVVFDTVGGENLPKALQALALYGQAVVILANSSVDLTPVFQKSGSLHAVFMLVPMLTGVQRERQGKILEKIADLVTKDVVKPLIDPKHFTFEQISDAHAWLESGKAIGKIVVSRSAF